jgi:hypothetical protein
MSTEQQDLIQSNENASASTLPCGLPRLTTEELMAIDTNSYNTLEDSKLRQIVESAAELADDAEASYIEGSNTIKMSANIKQICKNVVSLFATGKYRINVKNATAIVASNAIFSRLANSKNDEEQLTNAEYQQLLMAFGTEFEGSITVANTLNHVFIMLNDVSANLMTAQQLIKELSLRYSAAADVLDSRTSDVNEETTSN